MTDIEKIVELAENAELRNERMNKGVQTSIEMGRIKNTDMAQAYISGALSIGKWENYRLVPIIQTLCSVIEFQRHVLRQYVDQNAKDALAATDKALEELLEEQ